MRNKSQPKWITWYDDGLRTRFKPCCQISSFLFQIVPWLNVAVIVALLYVVSSKVALAPAVKFDLPSAPFVEGALNSVSLVMLSSGSNPSSVLVFFDDVRYRLAMPAERAALAESLAKYTNRFQGRDLLLLADKNITHGEVMDVVSIVRSAGFNQVSVGIK